MQRRGQLRIDERILARTRALALVLALALLCFACAGGSGSSGFDLAENAAIDMALDEQRCVESEGLTICPAGTTMQPNPDATMTRTATPVPAAPTATPTQEIDAPTGTPSTPPANLTATVESTATATPTETPPAIPTPTADGRMSVDTSFDGTEGSTCIPTDTPEVCVLPFTFASQGFSVDTHYQVAVRSTDDEPWELFDAVQISFEAVTSIFQTDIPIDIVAQDPATGVVIQTAVLVFVDQPPLLPAAELIERLAESGADFAYVSPLEELAVTQ